MSRTIELEVGDLYANLHEQFSQQLGDEYDEQARQQFEEFLHNTNQQVERQTEQVQQTQELDLDEDDIEDISQQADAK